MALSAPTGFKVRQYFNRIDDATFFGLDGEGFCTPAYEERVVELVWTEVEATSCQYEVVLAQGTADEVLVASIKKGVAKAYFTIERRERTSSIVKDNSHNNDDSGAYRLPDWKQTNFSKVFSVRAKSVSDQSSWVTLTVADNASTVEASVPDSFSLSSSADGLLISWEPDGKGYMATQIEVNEYIFGFRSGIGYVATVRAPATSLLVPHHARPIQTNDLVMQSYATDIRFRNGETYRIAMRSVAAVQQIYKQKRVEYGANWYANSPTFGSSVVWADAPTDLVVTPSTITPYVGATLRFKLEANVSDVTWELTGTVPEWVSLDGDTLVVTPSVTTQSYVMVQATDSVPTVKSAKITIRPLPRPTPPVVSLSKTVLNNGFSYKVGDPIVIQPSAPGATEWEVTLPAPLHYDRLTGRVYGTMLDVGTERFMIAWRARKTITAGNQIVSSDWSAPLEVPVKISPPDAGTNLAAARFGWLDDEWTLTDLQVDLISREVSTSRLVKRAVATTGTDAAGKAVQVSATRTTLVIKLHETKNFAVLFLKGNSGISLDDLNKVRLAIRPADNLFPPLFLVSDASPSAVEADDGNVYYLLSGKLKDSAKGQLLAQLDQYFGENKALPGIAEVEWTIDSSVYKSQSFNVDLEMDVVRD